MTTTELIHELNELAGANDCTFSITSNAGRLALEICRNGDQREPNAPFVILRSNQVLDRALTSFIKHAKTYIGI